VHWLTLSNNTVWGPPIAAENAQLISALAGPVASVDKVRPYFKGVTCRAILDFAGQEWGKGCLAKLVGNTFLVSMSETLGQGLTLAEKSGMLFLFFPFSSSIIIKLIPSAPEYYDIR
jgi:3-hydroxyisobutyrate dehydrogenase-like beta-hydroxyacid dehydrogenase